MASKYLKSIKIKLKREAWRNLANAMAYCLKEDEPAWSFTDGNDRICCCAKWLICHNVVREVMEKYLKTTEETKNISIKLDAVQQIAIREVLSEAFMPAYEMNLFVKILMQINEFLNNAHEKDASNFLLKL